MAHRAALNRRRRWHAASVSRGQSWRRQKSVAGGVFSAIQWPAVKSGALIRNGTLCFEEGSFRGASARKEPSSKTWPSGTRIKIFACAIHGECQLDDKIVGVNFCEECDERRPSAVW